MIIPVYKPVGASTHLLAKKVGDIYQNKATHTGTLDPMASGVVVVLTAEDRFKKSEFSDCKKLYEFGILWGVATDTHDLLGLTTQLSSERADLDQLENTLIGFKGKIIQQLPKFSAQRINGQSYFDQAKKKVDFEPRSEKIQIHSLELKNQSTITKLQLQENIKSKINLITGYFRQAEILNNWQQIIL